MKNHSFKKIKKYMTKFLSGFLIFSMLSTSYIPGLSGITNNVVNAGELCAEDNHVYEQDESLTENMMNILSDKLSTKDGLTARTVSSSNLSYYMSFTIPYCSSNKVDSIQIYPNGEININEYDFFEFNESDITIKNYYYGNFNKDNISFDKIYIEGYLSEDNLENEITYELFVSNTNQIFIHFIKKPESIQNFNIYNFTSCSYNNIDYTTDFYLFDIIKDDSNYNPVLNYKKYNYVSPTCAEEGSYDLYCTVCKNYIHQSIETLSHTYQFSEDFEVFINNTDNMTEFDYLSDISIGDFTVEFSDKTLSFNNGNQYKNIKLFYDDSFESRTQKYLQSTYQGIDFLKIYFSGYYDKNSDGDYTDDEKLEYELFYFEGENIFIHWISIPEVYKNRTDLISCYYYCSDPYVSSTTTALDISLEKDVFLVKNEDESNSIPFVLDKILDIYEKYNEISSTCSSVGGYDYKCLECGNFKHFETPILDHQYEKNTDYYTDLLSPYLNTTEGMDDNMDPEYTTSFTSPDIGIDGFKIFGQDYSKIIYDNNGFHSNNDVSYFNFGNHICNTYQLYSQKGVLDNGQTFVKYRIKSTTTDYHESNSDYVYEVFFLDDNSIYFNFITLPDKKYVSQNVIEIYSSGNRDQIIIEIPFSEEKKQFSIKSTDLDGNEWNTDYLPYEKYHEDKSNYDVKCELCDTYYPISSICTNHVWSTDTKTVSEPDCINEGFDSYYCINCGLSQYTDIYLTAYNDYLSTHENDVENADLHGKEQASSYRLNLKETNGRHQYEKISSASSCLTGGNALYKCSICGAEKSDGTYQDILEHSYHSEITTPATCTEDGEITYTCDDCEDTYVEVLEMTGHDYQEEITTPATCTEDGIKTFTCSKCSDTYTESINKTGHHYTVTHTKEPSDTEEGLYHYVCNNCSDEFDKVIPKTIPIEISAKNNGIGIYNKNNGFYYVTGSYLNEDCVSLIEENEDDYGDRELKLVTESINPIKFNDKTFYYGNPSSVDKMYLDSAGIVIQKDGYLIEQATNVKASSSSSYVKDPDCNTVDKEVKDWTIKTKFTPDKLTFSRWQYDDLENLYSYSCGYFIGLKDKSVYYATGYHHEHAYDDESNPYFCRYFNKIDMDDSFIDVSAYKNNIVALSESGQVYWINASCCDSYRLFTKEVARKPFVSAITDTNISFTQISAGDKVYGIDINNQVREIYQDGSYSEPINDILYTSISCGNGHYLAIDENGNVWSWGKNYWGQVGNGETGTIIETPVQITDGLYFTQVSAGDAISAAIDTNYNVYTWGYNSNQQLGFLKESLNSVSVPTILYNVEHIHYYDADSFRETNPITCNEDGIVSITCVDCGNVKYVPVSKREHVYINPYPYFPYWVDYKKTQDEAYITTDDTNVLYKYADAYLVAIQDEVNDKTLFYAISLKEYKDYETNSLFSKNNLDLVTKKDSISTISYRNVPNASKFFNSVNLYYTELDKATNISHADLVLEWNSDRASEYTAIKDYICSYIFDEAYEKFEYNGTCGQDHVYRTVCKYCYDVKEEVKTASHVTSLYGDRISEPGYIIYTCKNCGEVVKKEPIHYNIKFTTGATISNSSNNGDYSSSGIYSLAKIEQESESLAYEEEYQLPYEGSNSGTSYLNLGPFSTADGKHIIPVKQEIDYFLIGTDSETKYYPGDTIKNLTTNENESIRINVVYKTTIEDDFSTLYYKDSVYEVSFSGIWCGLNRWNNLLWNKTNNSSYFLYNTESREISILAPNTIFDVNFYNYNCITENNDYLTDVNSLKTDFTYEFYDTTENSGYVFSSKDEFKQAFPEYKTMEFNTYAHTSLYLYKTINQSSSEIASNQTILKSKEKINGLYIYIISYLGENTELYNVYDFTKYSYSNSMYLIKNDPYQLYTKYILHDTLHNTVMSGTESDIVVGTLNEDKTKYLKTWTTDEEGLNDYFEQTGLSGEIHLYSVWEDIDLSYVKNIVPSYISSDKLEKGKSFNSNEIFMVGESKLNLLENLISDETITNTSVELNTDDSNLKSVFDRHMNQSNRIDGLQSISNSVLFLRNQDNNSISLTDVTGTIEKIDNKKIIKTGINVYFNLNSEPVLGEIVKNITNNKISVLYNDKIYTPKYVYTSYTNIDTLLFETNDFTNQYGYLTTNGPIPVYYDEENHCYKNENNEELVSALKVSLLDDIYQLNGSCDVLAVQMHAKQWAGYPIDLIIKDQNIISYYSKTDENIYTELTNQDIDGEEVYYNYLNLYMNNYLPVDYYVEAYVMYAFANQIDISDILNTEKFYILSFPFEEELKQYHEYVEKYNIQSVERYLNGEVNVTFNPSVISLDTYSESAYEFLKTEVSSETLNKPENSEWHIKYDANHNEDVSYMNFCYQQNGQTEDDLYNIIPITTDTSVSEKLKIHVNTFSALQPTNKSNLKVSLFHNGKKIDITNSLAISIKESKEKYTILNGEHIEKIFQINEHYSDGATVILTKEGHIWANGYQTAYGGVHAITSGINITGNRYYSSGSGEFDFIQIGGKDTFYTDIVTCYSEIFALDNEGNVWTTQKNDLNTGSDLLKKETQNVKFVKIAQLPSKRVGSDLTLIDENGNIWVRFYSSEKNNLDSISGTGTNKDIHGADYSLSNSTVSYVQISEGIKFTEVFSTRYDTLFISAIDENQDLYLYGYISNGQIGTYQDGVRVFETTDYYKSNYTNQINEFKKITDLYPGVYDGIKWEKICSIENGSSCLPNYIDTDHNLWAPTNGYEIVEKNVLDADDRYIIDTDGKLHTRDNTKDNTSLTSNIICSDYTFKELGPDNNFYAITTDDKYIMSPELHTNSSNSEYILGLYRNIAKLNHGMEIYSLNEQINFGAFKAPIESNNASAGNIESYLDLENLLTYDHIYEFPKGEVLGHGNGFDIEIDYQYLRNLDKVNIKTGDYIIIQSVDSDTDMVCYITDAEKYMYGTVSSFLTDKNKTEEMLKSETPITMNTLEIERVTSDMNGAVLFLKSEYLNDKTKYYSNQITLDVVPLTLLKAEYIGEPVTVGSVANPEDILLTLKYDNNQEFTITYDDLTDKPDSLLITQDGDNIFNLGFETKDANVTIPGEFGITNISASYPESVWKGEEFDPSKIEVTVTYSDNTTANPVLDENYFSDLTVSNIGNNTFTFDYEDENGYSYQDVSFTVEGYYYDHISTEYKGNNVKVNTNYLKSDVEAKVYYTHNSFNKTSDILTETQWLSSVSENSIENKTTLSEESLFTKTWNSVKSLFSFLQTKSTITESCLITKEGNNEFVTTLADDENFTSTLNVTGYDWITNLSAVYQGDDIYQGLDYQKDDVKVTAYYSLRGEVILNSDEWTESSLTVVNVGQNQYTASYQGLSDVYTVNGYKEASIEAIYKGSDIIIGNDYNKDDVEVKVIYTNNTSSIIPSNLWTEDSLAVTKLNENTYQASYKGLTDNYTVNGIDAADHLTAVYQGDDIYQGLDYQKDDVLVQMVYKSGTKETISSDDWTESNLTVSNIGNNDYTATYQGKEAIYHVTGYKEESIKADYKGSDILLNNSYSKDDVEVIVYYTNHSIKTLTSDEWLENSLIVSKVGENIYQASYKGLTDNYTVNGFDIIQSVTAEYIGDDIQITHEYNKDDVKVTVTYQSGKVVNLTSNDWTESGLVVSKVGENQYEADYNGIKADYKVTGYDEIQTIKATYNGPDIYIGNEYKKSDVKVEITYISGLTEILKNDDWTESSLVVNKVKDNEYTGSYKDKEFNYTVIGYKEDYIKAEYQGENILIGNNYNKSDVKVTVVYTNLSEKVLTENEWTESSLTVEKEGKNQYTATYKDLTDDYEVLGYQEKNEYQVKEIKGTYPEYVYVGDSYQKEKADIIVTYEDKKGNTYQKELAYQYLDEYPENEIVKKVGNNEYSIGYQGVQGILTVPGYEIDHISAEYKGTKIYVGNEYKKSDVEVIVYFTNNTTEKITDFTVDNTKVTKADKNTFTATYKEKTDTFDVPGYKIDHISAEYKGPDIYIGNNYNKSDVIVTVYYTDKTSITVTDWKESSLLVSVVGDNSYTADYQGYTDGYTVKGLAIPVTDDNTTPVTTNTITTIAETVKTYVPTGDNANVAVLLIIGLSGILILFLKKNKNKQRK